MTTRVLREVARTLPPPARPLGAERVFRLRVGHAVLPVLWFAAHELSRGSGLSRLVVALVYAALWFGAIRWTLLRTSRAAPSWSVTIVHAAEATVIAGVLILVFHALTGSSDPLAGEVASVVAMGAIALLWQSTVAGHHALGEPLRTVMIGSPEMVRMIEREHHAPGARPFTTVGWIDDGSGVADECDVRARRLGGIDDIEAIIYGGGVDLFVLGVQAGRPSLYSRLLELGHLDFSVIELSAFFERTFGRVPLDDLSPTWFLHTLHLDRRDENSPAKRLIDIVLATVGLIAGAPILAATALAIRIGGGPGPILFHQVRIGQNGRQFTMFKFRSMLQDPASDTTTWTDGDDPRITPVGKVIRRFRIDELPQLVNVLRGEMAIVGPRPETPGYVHWLAEEIPFYQPRHFAKPGITGWAQVCAGYASSVDDSRTKLSYDLYYLRNRSLGLDLAIVLRTVAIVLGGFGAR